MAITFVAAGTQAHVASGNLTSVGLPAGHAANDILLLVVDGADNVTCTQASYTKIFENNSGTSERLTIFWKADNGAESAPTVTHTGGNSASARIFGFRGANTVAPFPTIGTANTGSGSGGSATITALGITPTAASSAIIFVAGSGESAGTGGTAGSMYASWSGSNPTFTEIGDNTSQDGTAEATHGTAWGLSNTGAATGNRTVALSNIDPGANAWVGVLLELAAATTSTATGDPVLWDELAGPGPDYGPQPFVEVLGDIPAAATAVSETPPPGGAVAQGVQPVAQVTTSPGGAVAQGNTPNPTVAVTPGGAVAQGLAPSPQVTAAPGGAVAQGVGATAKVDVGARGQALAGGQLADPLGGGVSENVPPGGAVAQGVAPSPQVAVTPGGAVAQGLAATIRVTTSPGGALAQGVTPIPSVTPGIGAAVAQGVGATARVLVGPGGAVAGGQLTDPAGVPPPGQVTIVDVIGTTVAVADTTGVTVTITDTTGADVTVQDTGSDVRVQDVSGADVTIIDT